MTPKTIAHHRAKIDQHLHCIDEISQIARNGGYAFPTRSNQETRDAALIAWSCAGLAMVLKL